MPKITRATQKVFGDNAGAVGNFGVFGSLAAGTPLYSKDPAQIQSLAAFLQGLGGAVVGNKSPAFEDINSLYLLAFRQLAYLFQQGVPEWDAETIYFQNGFASSGGKIYKSKTNDNLNNAVSDTNNWIEYVASIYTPPTVTLQKQYLFNDRQKLIERNSATGWTNTDLTPYIADAGLDAAGITVTGAIVGLRISLGRGPFANFDADAGIWSWGNASADNPLFAYCRYSANDSVASCADTNTGPVPLLDGSNLWYRVTNSGNSSGLFAQLFLSGFIYNQLIQL